MNEPGLPAALDYVQNRVSPFLKSAALWLGGHEHPSTVLLNLAGPISQKLGPWETFRYASLLNLVRAGSVQALAADIVTEPVDENTPAVAAMRALAHAQVHCGREVPRGSVDRLLELSANAPAKEQPAEACARYAARWAAAAAMGHDASEDRERSVAALRAPEGASTAVGVAEAAWLAREFGVAIDAIRVAFSGQKEDGSLDCGHRHKLLRGLYTLRASGLALLISDEQGSSGDDDAAA